MLKIRSYHQNAKCQNGAWDVTPSRPTRTGSHEFEKEFGVRIISRSCRKITGMMQNFDFSKFYTKISLFRDDDKKVAKS